VSDQYNHAGFSHVDGLLSALGALAKFVALVWRIGDRGRKASGTGQRTVI